jgi:hypothetical protein
MLHRERIEEKISFLRKISNIHRESRSYLSFGDSRAELDSDN